MGNGNKENRIKETHQGAGEQTNNNINNINTSITCSIGKSDCELREGNSASNDDLAKDDYTLFVLQLQGSMGASIDSDREDCPESESFLNGCTVFVSNDEDEDEDDCGDGKEGAEDEDDSYDPEKAEIDTDTTLKSGSDERNLESLVKKSDNGEERASYFLRRRRSVVWRRFLILFTLMASLASIWIARVAIARAARAHIHPNKDASLTLEYVTRKEEREYHFRTRQPRTPSVSVYKNFVENNKTNKMSTVINIDEPHVTIGMRPQLRTTRTNIPT